MRVEGHSEQEDGSSPADNRLYGLQVDNVNCTVYSPADITGCTAFREIM